MSKRMVQWSIIGLINLLLWGGWFALGGWAAPIHSTPTIHFVAPGGQCGTNTPCYTQLQAAVDAAATGDEIRVAAGLYQGVSARNGTSQLVYLDKTVTIRGGHDPQSWAFDPATQATILDAQGQGRGFYVTGPISPVIEGVRLTNGNGPDGGGLYVISAALTLRHSRIYSNSATSWGGGLYLKNSPATLNDNQIYANTTGSNGRGGGLALSNSPAILSGNVITANQAHVGGGIELANHLPGSGARLAGNRIQDNHAFDYVQNNTTFDGAGGGIDSGSVERDTLTANEISGNSAQWGGGLHLFDAAITLEDNTIQQNTAPRHGGGLYIQWSDITMQNNRVLSNTATNWGGGMYIWTDQVVIQGNTFQGNNAGWRGGGVYGQSAADFDGNLFLTNTAAEQGGGLFSYRDNRAVYRNNVFAANQANEGGGLYLWGGSAYFIHNTISHNTSADGRGVVIDQYPGLVNPTEPNQIPASVAFTNSIFSEQTVGIYATAANTLTVNSTLWHNVATPVDAAGANLTVQNDYLGDPRFEADGYHLQDMYSEAQDRGLETGLDHDLDGQLRPLFNAPDLGADEIMPTLHLEPALGGTVSYTDPHHTTALTISVPPGAVTAPIDLRFVPLPPPPPGLADTVFAGLITVGLPFRLDPFLDGLLLPPLTFSRPVTVTLSYEEQLKEAEAKRLRLQQAMARLEDALLAILLQEASCGPSQNDPADHRTSAPICNTGVSTTSRRSLQFRLAGTAPDVEFLYFIFLTERQVDRTYLPLITR